MNQYRAKSFCIYTPHELYYSPNSLIEMTDILAIWKPLRGPDIVFSGAKKALIKRESSHLIWGEKTQKAK